MGLTLVCCRCGRERERLIERGRKRGGIETCMGGREKLGEGHRREAGEGQIRWYGCILAFSFKRSKQL